MDTGKGMIGSVKVIISIFFKKKIINKSNVEEVTVAHAMQMEIVYHAQLHPGEHYWMEDAYVPME